MERRMGLKLISSLNMGHGCGKFRNMTFKSRCERIKETRSRGGLRSDAFSLRE